jgi:hypothetical protein
MHLFTITLKLHYKIKITIFQAIGFSGKTKNIQ